MKLAGAKGFDAYAHHPYYGSPTETPTTKPPPGKRGQPPTAVTLGNFEVLTKELTRLYGNMRIWVTEYGYQTNPPDRLFGVSPAKQALYMQQAWDKLAREPRGRHDDLVPAARRAAGRGRLAVRPLHLALGRKISREMFERLVSLAAPGGRGAGERRLRGPPRCRRGGVAHVHGR